MIKHALAFFSVIAISCATYAQLTVHVIDEDTGEAVPFVQIVINGNDYTMTNTNGDFRISHDLPATIEVTSCKHKSITQKITKDKETIKLRRLTSKKNDLTEDDIVEFLNKVAENLDNARSFKWNKSSCFFIRHAISEGKAHCTKDYLCKAGSAVNMHDTKIIDSLSCQTDRSPKGCWKFHTSWKRVSGNDTIPMNFETDLNTFLSISPCVFEISSLAYVIKLPLGSRCTISSPNGLHNPYASGKVPQGKVGFSKSRYKATIESLYEGDTFTGIYAVNFTSRYKSGWESLYGTMYVRKKDKRILGFEGYISPFQIKKTGMSDDTEVFPKVNIGYTHKRGFTEVQYVSISIDKGDLHIHSIAYNIGKKKPEKGSQWTECILSDNKE